MKLTKLAVGVAAALLPAVAMATNGMNLEGYGPVATSMGGASLAYDNGPGAMMNNPATLGLMGEGNGLGISLGVLGPDVKSSKPGQGSANSAGDAYYMPAIGYLHKHNGLTYGIGVYSQGGMGTEYGASSFLAMNTGENVRSEVGVGRVIVPLAYNVNSRLTVGGSIDWVWAAMDLKMAVQQSDFVSMAGGASGITLSSGTMAQLGGYQNVYRLDFSDNNDFSGKAFGSGFAGKLGFVFKVTPALSVGATYHSKTSLGDLETNAGGATIRSYDGSSATPVGMISGKIIVRNFQWPETYGLGIAYQVNDAWMVAADYKRINWSGVMQNFRMTYVDSSGDRQDFSMPQNWRDQNVYQLGASFRYSDKLTLRFGGNFANNPVPDSTLNPLFPAIIKDHYTAGVGYALNHASSVDFALTYAPEVTATNPNTGISTSHSQFNWIIQYGHRW